MDARLVPVNLFPEMMFGREMGLVGGKSAYYVLSEPECCTV